MPDNYPYPPGPQLDWFSAINSLRSHLYEALHQTRLMYQAGKKLGISPQQLKAVQDAGERIKSLTPILHTATENTLPFNPPPEQPHDHT